MQLHVIRQSRPVARTTNSYINKIQELCKQSLKHLHLGGRWLLSQMPIEEIDEIRFKLIVHIWWFPYASKLK